MLGLLRGFLRGVIAAATMCAGMRAIARGEKLPTAEVGRLIFNAATRWRTETGGTAKTIMMGMKGGSVSSCPPQGAAHHFAKCPSCGRRWHER